LNPIFTTLLLAANEFGAENAARHTASNKLNAIIKLLFMVCPPSIVGVDVEGSLRPPTEPVVISSA
jgi:hypothetical protein